MGMLHTQGHTITNGVCRPFAIVKKSDGRPAVEVDNDGKRQQFASYSQCIASSDY